MYNGGIKTHHPDMLLIESINGKKIFSSNHGERGFGRGCLFFRAAPYTQEEQGSEKKIVK
jgi:hypothetical protein